MTTATLTPPTTDETREQEIPTNHFRFSYFGWDPSLSERAGGDFDPFVDAANPQHHGNVIGQNPYHRRFYVTHPSGKMGALPIGEKDFDKNEDRYIHFDGDDGTHLLMHMGNAESTDRVDGMGTDCHRVIQVWLIAASPGTTREEVIALAEKPRNDDEDVITGDVIIDSTSPVVDLGAITLAG